MTEAIDIEKESLKSIEDKFKTLLTVETNTIENLSSRLKILDKDVSDVLTSDKAFFNEEKAAATLKESQKEERAEINKQINLAQNRIAVLKEDYTVDTTVIQKRIDKLREGDVDDKSEVYARIEIAEKNIINAQNNIDDLIIDREPLESDMIKLEAEVGPIKYIAALVVDWGVTNDVDLNEAVRWVILIIIMVFDPLAVALLLAANQSLMRRFPVEPLPPPPEIADLEKPEPYEPPIRSAPIPVNPAVKEKAEKLQNDWNTKLEAFNKKVPKPKDQPVEFIQEDNVIPHVDLKGQKKTKDKEIVADNDSFDEDEIKYDVETKTKSEREEEFKQREEEERQALEEYSRKAKEEEPSVSELLAKGFAEEQEAIAKEEEEEEEPTISEQIEEVMESERTRPDFTEVIEPEVAVKEMMSSPEKVIKDEVKIQSGQGLKRGALGAVIVEKRKVVKEIKPALPKEPNYVQNEEQNKDTIWNRTRENTAVEQTALPTITDNELKENFDIPITRQKFINYKNRLNLVMKNIVKELKQE